MASTTMETVSARFPGRAGTLLSAAARCLVVAACLPLGGCPRPANDDAPPMVGNAAGEGEGAATTATATEEPSGDPGEEVCIQGLVVSWKGAVDAPADVERTQEEAKARAEALFLRLEQDGRPFGFLVKESDLFQERNGLIGVFRENRWPPKHAALKDAIRDLNVHMHAPVVETAYGYVIPRRCLVSKTTFRKLTIAYRGAVGAGPDVELSKEEAQKKAEALQNILNQEPDLFPLFVRRHGDDSPEDKEKAGDMGTLTLGALPEPLDRFGDFMRDLAVSDPVERPEGFVLYQRVPIGYEPKVKMLPSGLPGSPQDAPAAASGAESGDTGPADPGPAKAPGTKAPETKAPASAD